MIETAASYPAYSLDQVKQMEYDLMIYKSAVEDLQNKVSSFTRLLDEKKNMIDNAKAAILEAFDNESFDRENFEVIADALNIELTKEVNVVLTVTFSGTVDVPLGFDIEGNLENYLDFEATANGWGNVDVECDLFEDGVDVSVV